MSAGPSHEWQDKNAGMRLAKATIQPAKTVVGKLKPGPDSSLPYIGRGAGLLLEAGRETLGSATDTVDSKVGDPTRKLADYMMKKQFPKISFYDASASEKPERSKAPVERKDVPYHMFDLKTQNLVDIWGKTPHYAILSHSWIGAEIEYDFIQKVRLEYKKLEQCQELHEQLRKEKADPMQIAVAEFEMKKYAYLKDKKNDVQRIIAQCDEDIRLVVKAIDRTKIDKALALARVANEKDDAKRAAEAVVRKAQDELKRAKADKTTAEKGVETAQTKLSSANTKAEGNKLEPASAALNKANNDLDQAAKDVAWVNVQKAHADDEVRKAEQQAELEAAARAKKFGGRFSGALSLAQPDALIGALGYRKREDLQVAVISAAKALEQAEARKKEAEAVAKKARELYDDAAAAQRDLEDSEDEHREAAEKFNAASVEEASISVAIAEAQKKVEAATQPATDAGTAAEEALAECKGLLTALQRRQSAEKIKRSLERAKEISDSIQEPNKELVPLYLWNDTCCINKAVVGEHQNSLAMMGEWYTNAEFCITHLDQSPSAGLWVRTWDQFVETEGKSPASPNFDTFDNIDRPRWSTRGWTLQELTLSRKIYFFNNVWDQLAPSESTVDAKKKIAEFSNVPVHEVCRGDGKCGLTAFDVMALLSTRELTVPCDAAYCLMGMLGVKFQAFYAEGITKALSRLIDEVVIATNDVSVFNWVGNDLASTITGRSLYPLNFDAFKKGRDEAQSITTEGKRGWTKGIFETYRKLTEIIHETRDFVSGADHEIVTMLQQAFGAVLDRIETDIEEPTVTNGQESDVVKDLLDQKTLMLVRKVLIVLKRHHKDLQRQASQKANEEKGKARDTSRNFHGIAYGAVGQTLFMSRSGYNFPDDLKKIVREFLPVPQKEEDTAAASKKDMPKEPEKKGASGFLLEEFRKKLHAIEDRELFPTKKKGSSISEKESAHDTSSAPEGSASTSPPTNASNATPSSMISPNPIIVHTSGIEGTFDIQRVLVVINEICFKNFPSSTPEPKTYSGEEMRQVVEATTKQDPTRIIYGKCSISTGIAIIKDVAFSCTALRLKNQLDVCDVINNFLSVENNDPNKLTTRALKEIGFVQASNVTMVAGEWVLTRFSGVEGANWFLCLLELGSSHEFHGRRIPTSIIDFRNGDTVLALRTFWRQYMKEKTRGWCQLLRVIMEEKKSRTDLDQSKKDLGEAAQNVTKLGGVSTAAETVWDVARNAGYNRFKGMEARLREKDLRDDALKNAEVPKFLQAAVLNLEEDTTLPAMFFAGKQVHMF